VKKLFPNVYNSRWDEKVQSDLQHLGLVGISDEEVVIDRCGVKNSIRNDPEIEKLLSILHEVIKGEKLKRLKA